MRTYRTRQRQALAEWLEGRVDRAFSAREAAEALAGAGVSLSAVYRNLAAMEKEGQLRRVGAGEGGEARYEFSDRERCGTHLHLSCGRCGRTFHVDERTSGAVCRAVAAAAGFEVDELGTSIQGICADCRRRTGPQARPHRHGHGLKVQPHVHGR
ncbi:MAG: transcriptional repressor [Kiritimatiellae bacterium]|nr:transcriptional repressor [Kiritimatiellia bacterium]